MGGWEEFLARSWRACVRAGLELTFGVIDLSISTFSLNLSPFIFMELRSEVVGNVTTT